MYSDGAISPPRYERAEVAEIRILASYIHRYRDRGRFVYVEVGTPTETVLAQLIALMKGKDVEVLADYDRVRNP